MNRPHKFASEERRRLAVDEGMKSKRLAEEATERQERKTQRTHETRPLKTNTLPARYEKGFLAKLDARTELARELHTAYAELTEDLGGADSLSHVRRVLAEKFCWLSAILRGIELQFVDDDKTQQAELLGRWIQALNSLTGLARTLGLERRARKLDDLGSYIRSKSKRAEE